ncbi:hypothetical protein U1Q18_014079 [Sarracenia purpurea var. burkii]
MELYPGLALCRVFYEFSMYEYEANLAQTNWMRWQDLLNGRSDGMKDVLIIMVVEWLVFVFFLNYVGKKSPLFFFRRKPASSSQRTSLGRDGSGAFDQVEKADVAQEVAEVSLRSANLINGGVADKQVGKYSGGMKRRLSVAIKIEFSNSLYVICLGIYSCA